MAERKAFLIRIDSDLWGQLEAWAQDELRSVNGQIEYILRQAVEKRRGSGSLSEKDNEQQGSGTRAPARNTSAPRERTRRR